MQRNKFNNISFFIVIFILGVAFGFWVLLFTVERFSFAREISLSFDPINLITLFATVLLAFYVTRRLEKINEQERVEKSLMIEDLKSFKEMLLIETRYILNTKKITFTQVTSKMKTLRLNLISLTKLIKKYNFVKSTDVLQNMDSKIRDIKDLFTDGTNTLNTSNQGIKIVKNEITFSEFRRDEIEKAITEMRQFIFEIAVQINKK